MLPYVLVWKCIYPVAVWLKFVLPQLAVTFSTKVKTSPRYYWHGIVCCQISLHGSEVRSIWQRRLRHPHPRQRCP